MKQSGRSAVSSMSLFDSVKSAEMMKNSLHHNSGSPAFSLTIPCCPFEAASRSVLRFGITAVLGPSCYPKIFKSIVGLDIVDVINILNWPFSCAQKPCQPMRSIFGSGNANCNIAVSSQTSCDSSFFASTFRQFPSKITSLWAIIEHLFDLGFYWWHTDSPKRILCHAFR